MALSLSTFCDPVYHQNVFSFSSEENCSWLLALGGRGGGVREARFLRLIMTLSVVSWTLYQSFGNLCRLSWHICSYIYEVIDTLVVHFTTFSVSEFLLAVRWPSSHIKNLTHLELTLNL